MATLTQIELLLPELHSYARWICTPPDDPEDLVQSAVERTLRAESPPVKLVELRPWMFRVIRNLHMDELRRHRVRREYLARESRLSDEASDQRDVSRDVLIRLAFEKLPPEKREILFLVDIIGLKYSETADVVGVSQGTVMSRVSRARQALRWAIEGRDSAETSSAGKAQGT